MYFDLEYYSPINYVKLKSFRPAENKLTFFTVCLKYDPNCAVF